MYYNNANYWDLYAPNSPPGIVFIYGQYFGYSTPATSFSYLCPNPNYIIVDGKPNYSFIYLRQEFLTSGYYIINLYGYTGATTSVKLSHSSTTLRTFTPALYTASNLPHCDYFAAGTHYFYWTVPTGYFYAYQVNIDQY